jgi:hypothetical protein
MVQQRTPSSSSAASVDNNKDKKDKKTPSADAKAERRRKKGGTGLNDLFIGVFAVMFMLSLTLNFLQTTGTIEHTHETPLHQAMLEFKKPIRNRKREKLQPAVPQMDFPAEEQQHQTENHDALPMELHLGSELNLAEMNCDAFGGPSRSADAQEMVYWADIPSDALYQSPFRHSTETKYLTFEPDGGGWNNIRMAMESVIGLSIAMGRTLVMPPQKKMYLLAKNDNKQRKHFSFVDFFPIEEMAQEHVGLDVITMKEYLETQALTGTLINKVRTVLSVLMYYIVVLYVLYCIEFY